MKFAKSLSIALLAFAVVLVTVIAALFMLDWNSFTDEAEAFVGGVLDRDVKIGGLEIDPGWTTRIRLADVRVANTDWGKAESLASASTVVVLFKVLPLLTGNFVLPEIVIDDPRLSLERDRDGRANWNLGTAAETAADVAAPETRDEFPTIGSLQIKGGEIRYRDALRNIDLNAVIAVLRAEAREVVSQESIELSVDGTLQDSPLSLLFTGGSLVSLRDTDQPYPVDLRLTVGATEIRIDGEIDNPLRGQDMAVNVALKGKSLTDVFPILAIPLPETPPYRLSGALKRQGEKWQITNLDGAVGDSDLSGSLSLDQSGDRPFLTGDLKSKRLDFDDLAGLIGAAPDPKETASAEQKKKAKAEARDKTIFPDTPFVTKRLHAVNMDLRFTGAQVEAENLPLEKITARFRLDNGRLEIRPFDVSVAKGRISGELAFNARTEIPSADADLSFKELDLKPFFKDTELVQEMGGRFSGKVYLVGTGRSLKDVMGTADGDGWLGIRDGTISGLLIEAVGLDVAEALSLVLTDDARVSLRCGRMDLGVKGGVLTAKRAIVDTADSILLGRGNANLSSEQLDLRFEARPKDFSLVDASAPVLVKGRFEDPSISIGSQDALPFFQMGKATDIDCARLLRGELDHRDFEKDNSRPQ